MNHAERFASIAASYRRRRRLAELALAAGLALLAAGTAHALGLPSGTGLFIGAVAAALAGAWAWHRERSRPVTAQVVARHFNRTVPGVEESAELLLEPPQALPLVARLERSRVEAAFSRLGVPGVPSDQSAGRAALAGCGAALVGAALFWFAPPTAPHRNAVRPPTPPASGALIGGVIVRVSPPAYTKQTPTESREWDVEAPEGATVGWRVAMDATHAWIVTSRGDTIALEPGGEGGSATLSARASLLYQVIAERGGQRTVSDFHRFAVRTDAGPSVLIVAPHGRTELAPGDSRRVAVEVAAGDDYGLGSSKLVATLTSGEGEAVKFREQTFALAPTGARADLPHGITLRATLDLTALGLKPGDELYFHAEVSDRRAPEPNRSRSETVFLSIPDTTRVATATITGIALRLQPEFFRSERQIIIDTEKLLADRPRITPAAFRGRSNDIGMDQGLLRARYGQFVGDETETGDDPASGHQHDTPENATLLAASVKAKLKGALEQMWAAELRLRTYRPAEALPYEYRALDLLKQAQQGARVYVQKVGFEPPPLDPARTRLTGKLDAIVSRADHDSAARAPSLPAVRSAVALLGATGPELRMSPAGVRALEEAQVELAPLALAHADQLATMRALRALADSARAGAGCAGCVAAALHGLLRALPKTSVLPASEGVRASSLAVRYFERLESGP